MPAHAYARNNPLMFVDEDGRDVALRRFPGLGRLGVGAVCTLGLVEPTPLGEIACACLIGAGISMMAGERPPGFWDAVDGAEEWGRRNKIGKDAGRRRFHEKKGKDPLSRPDDDYSVNPDTGDIAGPDGEIVDNLGD